LRQHPGGLLDVGCDDLNVLVVRQRLRDQLVQYRVVELLPPFSVGSLLHILLGEDGTPGVYRLLA
jgi:hypothetical protein